MSQYWRDSQFISQIVKQVQQMEKERSGGKKKCTLEEQDEKNLTWGNDA